MSTFFYYRRLDLLLEVRKLYTPLDYHHSSIQAEILHVVKKQSDPITRQIETKHPGRGKIMLRSWINQFQSGSYKKYTTLLS